jgi:hypothetical protein
VPTPQAASNSVDRLAHELATETRPHQFDEGLGYILDGLASRGGHKKRSSLRPPLAVEGLPAFLDSVDQDHIAGRGIGPPPAQRGVQDQTSQHRGGQQSINERDPALGAQHRVVEPATGRLLAGRQGEHDQRRR